MAEYMIPPIIGGALGLVLGVCLNRYVIQADGDAAGCVVGVFPISGLFIGMYFSFGPFLRVCKLLAICGAIGAVLGAIVGAVIATSQPTSDGEEIVNSSIGGCAIGAFLGVVFGPVVGMTLF